MCLLWGKQQQVYLYFAQSQCSLSVCYWSIRPKHVSPVLSQDCSGTRHPFAPGGALGSNGQGSTQQHTWLAADTVQGGASARVLRVTLLCFLHLCCQSAYSMPCWTFCLNFWTYLCTPSPCQEGGQPWVFESVFSAEIAVVRQEQIAVFFMPPVEAFILDVFSLAGTLKSWQGYSNTTGTWWFRLVFATVLLCLMWIHLNFFKISSKFLLDSILKPPGCNIFHLGYSAFVK